MSTDQGSIPIPGDSDPKVRWLRDQSTRADRQLTYAALDAGRKAFEQVANNEYGAGRQGVSLKDLGQFIESDDGRAVARFLGDLRDVLFDSPEDVFDGKATEGRFLVEYSQRAKILELGKFVERILFRTVDGNPPTSREVTDFLLQWIHSPRLNVLAEWPDENPERTNSTSERTAVDRWVTRLEAIERDLRRAIQTNTVLTAVESAQEAAEVAQRASNAARQAAGEKGAAKLGDHFAKVATRENRLASQWTAFTIAAIVAVVGIGGLVLRQSSEEQRWAEALVHLAIVLPIIGLASYTARIARHHRMYARWSDTAAVQIESIAAFAEQLSEEPREQLILSLGQSVFASPAFSDDPRTEHISAIPADLVDALKALVEKLPRPGTSS